MIQGYGFTLVARDSRSRRRGRLVEDKGRAAEAPRQPAEYGNRRKRESPLFTVPTQRYLCARRFAESPASALSVLFLLVLWLWSMLVCGLEWLSLASTSAIAARTIAHRGMPLATCPCLHKAMREVEETQELLPSSRIPAPR
jgi:hypothetical protein